LKPGFRAAAELRFMALKLPRGKSNVQTRSKLQVAKSDQSDVVDMMMLLLLPVPACVHKLCAMHDVDTFSYS
jgi:hypothetical protein